MAAAVSAAGAISSLRMSESSSCNETRRSPGWPRLPLPSLFAAVRDPDHGLRENFRVRARRTPMIALPPTGAFHQRGPGAPEGGARLRRERGGGVRPRLGRLLPGQARPERGGHERDPARLELAGGPDPHPRDRGVRGAGLRGARHRPLRAARDAPRRHARERPRARVHAADDGRGGAARGRQRNPPAAGQAAQAEQRAEPGPAAFAAECRRPRRSIRPEVVSIGGEPDRRRGTTSPRARPSCPSSAWSPTVQTIS